jgi:hypothetical protein
MSDELNDVKNKIDEYDQKLRNAEEKGKLSGVNSH